eukprot:COSAG01_NODE_25647_length_738_cov_1.305164_1_plen_134_part_10
MDDGPPLSISGSVGRLRHLREGQVCPPLACSGGWGGRTRSSPDQSRAEVEPAAAETQIGACSEMAHSGGPGTLRRLSISLQASLSKLDQRSPVASQAADISVVGAVEEVAPPIQYRVVAPGAVREGPELESVKI